MIFMTQHNDVIGLGSFLAIYCFTNEKYLKSGSKQVAVEVNWFRILFLAVAPRLFTVLKNFNVNIKLYVHLLKPRRLLQCSTLSTERFASVRHIGDAKQ